MAGGLSYKRDPSFTIFKFFSFGLNIALGSRGSGFPVPANFLFNFWLDGSGGRGRDELLPGFVKIALGAVFSKGGGDFFDFACRLEMSVGRPP